MTQPPGIGLDDERVRDVVAGWGFRHSTGTPCNVFELCGHDTELVRTVNVAIERLSRIDRRLALDIPWDIAPHEDSAAPGPPADFPRIPGYQIETRIGRGGMGVVYRARQLSLNRAVAVKMLPGGIPGRHALAQRLRAEAQTLAQLAHPHIVRIFDVHDQNDLLFLVMEFVDGTDLARQVP
ncbi:MAG: protein kinase, partial [Planctomycetes bacterium]|nr:protein kinase [Planctomycetota bacterium]